MPKLPIRKAILGLILVLGCACSPAPQPQSVPPSPSSPIAKQPILVAFGDSLTEGLGVDIEQTYPAQLERRLKAEGLPWVVVNAGLSGETSSGARSRLGWVLKLNPDAVLLETGGNDGLRGIDPKITRENIAFLVDELQRRDIPVMLAGMKTLTNMGADYTAAFEAIYPAVAKDKAVPLIPFFLEGVGGVVELNQEDRIHPTEKGYSKIVEQIAPTVIPWLKGLPPASGTPDLPETRSTP
jgi:acyl-CoA thioesterase-1